MGYQQVEIDVQVNEHFGKVHQHCHKKLGHKWDNPIVEKVWREKVGHHDFLYWMHVKTGQLGNHHHFTIVFEIRNGHEKLIDVHEGHKTFF